MRRRQIPPIPLEIITDHPRVIALPVAGFGMLMRLVQHFWQTECAPLPTDSHQLFLLSHAHRPTWASHSAEIEAILAETLPVLVQAREWRNAKNRALDRMRDKAVSTIRARALIRKALVAGDDLGISTARPIRTQENRAPVASLPDGFSDRT